VIEDQGGKRNWPCPCCGFDTFDEPPGSYASCPICFWDDDAVQLRWPELRGGANHVSLIDGQRNFVLVGASDPRLRAHCRMPRVGESIEPGWRPVDPQLDNYEREFGGVPALWPDDLDALYWWRRTYWRKPVGGVGVGVS